MSDWFGKLCEHQCCQWEDTELVAGPEYKEAYPELIFCDYVKNPDGYEGNCTEKLCPLHKKEEE